MARTKLHYVRGNLVRLAHTLSKSDFDTTGNTEKFAALSYCRYKTTFDASPIISAALTHIDLGVAENVSLPKVTTGNNGCVARHLQRNCAAYIVPYCSHSIDTYFSIDDVGMIALALGMLIYPAREGGRNNLTRRLCCRQRNECSHGKCRQVLSLTAKANQALRLAEVHNRHRARPRTWDPLKHLSRNQLVTALRELRHNFRATPLILRGSRHWKVW